MAQAGRRVASQAGTLAQRQGQSPLPPRGETIASAREYLTSDNQGLLGGHWPPPSLAPSLPDKAAPTTCPNPRGGGRCPLDSPFTCWGE